jgi:hypothetical protein
MRKFIVIGFVVLLVTAILIFAATFDVNKYHGTIQSELTGTLQNLLGEAKTPAQVSKSQGQQQPQQQNPMQQLMGAFGNKKKPDQQPPK